MKHTYTAYKTDTCVVVENNQFSYTVEWNIFNFLQNGCFTAVSGAYVFNLFHPMYDRTYVNRNTVPKGWNYRFFKTIHNFLHENSYQCGSVGLPSTWVVHQITWTLRKYQHTT